MINEVSKTENQGVGVVQLGVQLPQYPCSDRYQLRVVGVQKRDEFADIPTSAKLIRDLFEVPSRTLGISNYPANFPVYHTASPHRLFRQPWTSRWVAEPLPIASSA